MEKKIDGTDVETVLSQFEQRLKAAEGVVQKLDEQMEKRAEARLRERELEARILEAHLKWRPKDWFILSSICGGIVAFLATLIIGLILAFSYVPPTTVTKTVIEPAQNVNTNAGDLATNNVDTDFTFE
nr:MAG TPA: hemolysin [Caudoviricetes sp.]